MHIKVIDELCVGCQVCELVCSYVHFNEYNMNRSAIKVTFKDRFADKVHFCRQCKNALCVKACPENALVQKVGFVEFNKDLCIGCKLCVEICPFNAMFMDENVNIALKCDLCGGDKKCIDFCQKNAIVFVDN